MNKFEKPMVFFGALLYPVYALPWVIKFMLKNDRLGYFLFSFTMAYFAYLMVPYDTMDITRYYEAFNALEGVELQNVMDITLKYNNMTYYFFYLYMWVINSLGLPQEFLPFSVIFAVYMLYFKVLRVVLATNNRDIPNRDIQNRDIQSKKILGMGLLTLGIFLIVNELRFIGATSGMRNILAFLIFIYAIMLVYLKNRTLFPSLLILFATALHASIFPLLLVFIVSNLFFMKKILRVLFIISLFLLFTGSIQVIFYALMHLLEPSLRANGLYFPAYMDADGAWGLGFYENQNIKSIILEKFIKPAPFYIGGLYLFVVKDFTHKKIQNFLYLLFIFIVLVSISRTMMDRYSYFFSLFFMMVLILEFQFKSITNFKKIFLVLLIASMFLMNFGNIVKYRDIFATSWAKTLIVPLPFMFLQSVTEKQYIKRESL